MSIKTLFHKLFPKKYRTLIRVEKVGDPMHIVIPGWTPHKILKVRFNSLPRKLRKNVTSHCHLIGWVNLAAEDVKDLRISYEKIASPPDPNDGLA